MSIYSIYTIKNIVSQLYYIGYTSRLPQKRFTQHKYAALTRLTDNHLYRAIRKYGIENFEFCVIYQSHDRDHTANVMEPYFVSEYDSYKNGYNETTGGHKNFTHSPTTVDKIAKANEASAARYRVSDESGSVVQESISVKEFADLYQYEDDHIRAQIKRTGRFKIWIFTKLPAKTRSKLNTIIVKPSAAELSKLNGAKISASRTKKRYNVTNESGQVVLNSVSVAEAARLLNVSAKSLDHKVRRYGKSGEFVFVPT